MRSATALERFELESSDILATLRLRDWMPESKTNPRIRRTVIRTILFLAVGGLIGFGAYGYLLSRNVRILKTADRYLTIDESPGAAEELARQVLFVDPDNHEAVVVLGTALNQQKKFKEAINAFRRVPPSSESYPEAGYGAAACLMFEGRYHEAESLLKSLLKLHSSFDSARELLRTLYVRTYRVREALELVSKRYRQIPDDLTYLPLVLKTATEFPSGLGIENELAIYNQRFPKQPAIVAALARAYWLKGKTEQADGHFHELVQLKNPVPVNLAWAAQFWVETGDLAKAEMALDRAENSIGGAVSAPYQIATIRSSQAALAYAKHDYKQTRELLNEAIALCPEEPLYYLKRAVARRRLGDQDGAREDNARGMRLGASVEELRRLASRVKNGDISPAVCENVSKRLAELGDAEFSTAWRRLAVVLAGRSQ